MIKNAPVVAGDGSKRFRTIDPRDIKIRAVDWIDRPYLARNQFHLLVGQGGAYKGTLAALWAAEASRRGERVLMLAAEENLAEELKPKLAVAGADFERIRFEDEPTSPSRTASRCSNATSVTTT